MTKKQHPGAASQKSKLPPFELENRGYTHFLSIAQKYTWYTVMFNILTSPFPTGLRKDLTELKHVRRISAMTYRYARVAPSVCKILSKVRERRTVKPFLPPIPSPLLPSLSPARFLHHHKQTSFTRYAPLFAANTTTGRSITSRTSALTTAPCIETASPPQLCAIWLCPRC